MKTVAAILGLALAAAISASTHAASDPPETLLSALHWRSVGPYVGGRVVAVAGVPSEPNLFYMGAVDGGIWKSTDYGLVWTNISDGTLPGDSTSIGAIAVAPSNPSLIYAGTGESDIRGDVITGDGVFKSTDAGKTWQAAGLSDTHAISGIVIDPHNANVVYVSAMGHVFKGNTERGVFKSVDGGRSWKKVLFIDENTGAIGLAMDPQHPATLYAAMWQAERHPWKLVSGGTGSGLYKTIDGGAHWTNLSHNPGYPTGVLGRLGVGIAASNPRIVYSIVQAKEGGVFRSDDGGATWRRTNDQMELRQRAFYYMCIFVDPTNPNTVWVPNVLAVWKSIDGGKSFVAVRTPHGDNHIIWINPHDPKILLEGNDGGATVSTDGGKTWSSVQNQPTGQFYHVSLDNQFPFHIYGAQQDEGSTEGPSASVAGAIGNDEWRPAAYGESTFVAPQPDNPNVTYGSGYFTIFLQYDATTGQLRSVSPYPYYEEGAASEELKYRWGWTHPVLFSPANPKELFIASQYVQKSDDYGQTWQTISPDLTRNDKSTEGPTGGPIDLDQTSAEVYPDVSSLAISPLDNDLIWAGSADGLVHVTTDGGSHWNDVTPPALPQTAQISSIEASHFVKGTAYLTASRYMWDDFHPYVYETNDYGADWTTVTGGVPSDEYAFAIRQDPTVPNLLFLGTKNTVYVSFDGGWGWQALSLNLPKVQVRDIAIDTRQGDVAVATHGRAFWLLDNLALLEQLAKSSGAAPGGAQVFSPQTAWLTHAYGSGESEEENRAAGQNPPFGASIFLNVPKSYNGKTPVSLTVSDASGNVVRTFSLHYKTKPPKDFDVRRAAYEPAKRQQIREQLHTGITPRMNSFQWDLRYTPAADVNGYNPPIAAGGEDDTVDGPTVVPGTYTVTLDYGGDKTSAPLTVALDPRLHPAPGGLEARLALQQQIVAALDKLDRTINEALALRERLMRTKGGAVVSSLDAQIDNLVQFDVRSSEGGLLKETKLHDHLAYLDADVGLAWDKPTVAQYAVWNELSAKTDAAVAQLQKTIAEGRQFLSR